MLERKDIVINTGPIIALVAALDDLSILRSLYRRVLVPYEACQEIEAGAPNRFAAKEFEQAFWLEKWPKALNIMPVLSNSLDSGEASVIQLALNENIATVCIDESRGRRLARLAGLCVTGSIGILLRAKQEGHSVSIYRAVQQMQERGVWLSERV